MSKRIKEKFCLTWLYKNLLEAGMNKLCLRHYVSAGIEDIVIVYLDVFLQERFMLIYRTSGTRYRIRHNGKTDIAQTAKGAAKLVLDILHKILVACDYSKTMTLYEHVTMESLRHGDKINLYTRGKGDKK